MCNYAMSNTDKPGQSDVWRGMYWSILLMVLMPFSMVGALIVAVRRAQRRVAEPACRRLPRRFRFRAEAEPVPEASRRAPRPRGPGPERPSPLPAAAPISKLESSAGLDAFLAGVAAETVEEFAKQGLTAEGLSIAVIDLTRAHGEAGHPSGGYRADESSYPCSVVKICFLSYYEAQKEAGRLADNPELVRAVKDMITVSSNDATGFVVDSITGTTSGPEIADAAEWKTWQARRNAVNDWYRARGYTNLNANQKTFCEDAYGREQAFRDRGKNRNRMSAAEAARLFKEIAEERSRGRSARTK